MVGKVRAVTDPASPSPAAQLVVAVVASLALLCGAAVLAVSAVVALLLGTPAWLVVAAVVAALVAFATLVQRMRRDASRS